ncbi:PTS sugar transporter subunit IIA [Marinithermofilum abyssi]|jgi:transcriptional antiterminator/mannitol/fructose-specific phosphotransferase system IIA component (Ntr-type)|uniref:Ascorbate-specific PTS system EIIA component n=1 Tax=Marinithermofilum abyssi TaxID=1571185 RepID=A0A8J2VBM9_9BACL|nr:BglG family transcription antiterminator [Marinithermofilum abyssi]GGE08343.1 PTS sugar transporter subunit IIA [Marinithermofilum abyssi]
MQLDSRSTKLLNEVVSNPGLKSDDLERKHDLNRRQLKYSFDKINDWLDSKNLPKIKRTRQGTFVIHPVLVSTLLQEEDVPVQETIPSEQERVHMILLMLLCCEEDLSLFHFTSVLEFSKNTILNDLKKAQTYLDPYEIEIQYSRRHGYLLAGKEFSIRHALIALVNQCLSLPNGKRYLEKATALAKEEIHGFRRKIEDVEVELGLQFTDDRMEAMPYILALTLKRIQQKKIIEPFSIHYDELSDTKEYRATELILNDAGDIPIVERLFITLHLLTTNVYSSENEAEDLIPNLRQALREMLVLFEKRSCIILKDKEQLLNKLLLHTKPAYYRMKYRLTDVHDIHQTVSSEFFELHRIARQAMQPLEEFIGEPIPENEAMYLSMLLGGWLTKQGDSLQKKIKAVVVCPKGVSISRLMLSQLNELFPEFIFLEPLSIREFQTYPLHYDLVFSSVYVQTEKRLFIISPLMDETEKHRLRKQVMTETGGFVPTDMQLNQLLKIIEKHASVEDKDALAVELGQFLRQENAAPGDGPTESETPNLSDFLHEGTIQRARGATSWDHAVRIAAEPLLANQWVLPSYIEAILSPEEQDPYIIIGSGVAIPHADPEKGVKRVAMSLLQLDEGVPYAGDHMVHTIVVIAAPDKYQHLKALRQLVKLSQNREAMHALTEAGSVAEMASLIEAHSTDD